MTTNITKRFTVALSKLKAYDRGYVQDELMNQFSRLDVASKRIKACTHCVNGLMQMFLHWPGKNPAGRSASLRECPQLQFNCNRCLSSVLMLELEPSVWVMGLGALVHYVK